MMRTRTIQIALPALMLLMGACAAEPPADAERPADAASRPVAAETPRATVGAPYAFEQPDVAFALPERLREISGLTLLPDGRLGAVQDEEGTLFVLNRETGAVEARYPFGAAGDYEGLELVGDRAFVLRSDGTLLALTGWTADAPQVQTYRTGLKEKHDAEGLGYDAAQQRLLIACKEDPGGGLPDDRKAIYAFDPARGTLAAEPAYVIDTRAVERQLPGGKPFKPSALAVHPGDGAVYVLSAAARAVAVLDPAGGLRHVWPLPASLFEQPEGLAFLPDGTLFVASEGDEGPAMLYQFSYSGTAR